MALISCYECGKQISDQAKACPHCGAPAKVKYVNVTIWREYRKWWGAAVVGKVLIDGKLVCSADNGVRHTVPVSTGEHIITIQSRTQHTAFSDRTKSYKFTVGNRDIKIELVLKDEGSTLLTTTCVIVPEIR